MSTPRLTDQQKIDIVEKYKTAKYSYSEIGRLFGIQSQRVIALLKCRNIPRLHDVTITSRKYNLNQHYFDTIDTEEKAYFLGLLYADGCNYVPRGSVSIGLQERDIDILERFKSELECNKPLTFINKRSKNPAWQNSYSLEICSKKISNRLIELGIPQNKSFIIKFPTEEQIPKNLIRPFLLGAMDGDGNFSIYDSGRITPRIKIGFVGTEDFCIGFAKILKEELNCNSSYCKRHKDKDTTTRQLSMSGNIQVMRTLDWLYGDATIYLQRKYEKYLMIIQELEKFAEMRRIRNLNGKN